MPDHTTTGAWVDRYDRGPLLRSYVRPDGTLLVEGFAAREGILEYRDAAGRVTRELVTADAIRTGAVGLSRAPVTLQHPNEDVTPETYQRDSVGDVDGEVAIEQGGFTRVKLAVRRADAIKAVRGGTVEMSAGYATQLDPTPGVHPQFGRYDARQLTRRTNHLAIVDTARAGHEIRLRADSAEATSTFRADSATTAGVPARSNSMLSILLQGLALLGIANRYDSEELAAGALVDALRARNDAASKADAQRTAELATAVRERDEARTAVATLTTDRDAHKARADAADAKVKALETAAATRADADDRAKLEPIAKRMGIDPAKHPTLPELRRAVAAKRMPSGELRADATDAYVQVLVDQALEDHRSDGEGFAAGRRAWSEGEARNDGAERNDGPDPRNLSENDRWLAKVAAARKSASA